jgi:hypothetical protein
MVKTKKGAVISYSFAKRVNNVPLLPVDNAAYDTSYQGVMREIFRIQNKVRHYKTPKTDKPKLLGRIARLRSVAIDLQMALEGVTF